MRIGPVSGPVIAVIVAILLVAGLAFRLAHLGNGSRQEIDRRELAIRLNVLQERVEAGAAALLRRTVPADAIDLHSVPDAERRALRARLGRAPTTDDGGALTAFTSTAGIDYLVMHDRQGSDTRWAVETSTDFLRDVGVAQAVTAGLDVRIAIDGVVLFTSTLKPRAWSPRRFAAGGGDWEIALLRAPGVDAHQVAPWSWLVYAGLTTLLATVLLVPLARRRGEDSIVVKQFARRVSLLNARVARLLEVRDDLGQKLLRAVSTDDETGLLRRQPFIDHLVQFQSRLARSDAGSGVLVAVHGNRFAEIRTMGPKLIPAVMGRMVEAVKDELHTELVCCRYYENCLMVLCPHPPAAHETTAAITERLHRALSTPLDVRDRTLQVDPLVLTVSFDCHTDITEVCHQLANRLPPGTSSRGSGELSASPGADLYHDLPAALHNGEVDLYFQPIVHSSGRHLIGFEALVRWNHPTEGLLLPERFYPIASALGLMESISAIACSQAIAALRAWQIETLNEFYVSIDAPPDQFLDFGFAARILQQLDEAGVPRSRLRLEITEETVLIDGDRAVRIVSDLREAGVEVMLDSFGTGYSAMRHLRVLRPRGVKLDRTFVDDVVTDSRAFGMMKALVDLIHYLDFDCVVEGIETLEQLEMVRIASCDYLQGCLFADPLDLAAAAELARNGSDMIRVPGKDSPPVLEVVG